MAVRRVATRPKAGWRRAAVPHETSDAHCVVGCDSVGSESRLEVIIECYLIWKNGKILFLLVLRPT